MYSRTIFLFVACCVFDFVQLLDFEARSGEQVPLLLKMKRSQLALSKAVESGDTDLGECLSPNHLSFIAGWTKYGYSDRSFSVLVTSNYGNAGTRYACITMVC